MRQTPHTFPDETPSLRRCVREMAALSALSAVWSRSEPREIAQGLSVVISRSLPLDLVYVRVNGLNGAATLEVARTPQGPTLASQAQAIGKDLEPLLKTSQPEQTMTMPDPFGSGILRLAVIPIGCEGDCRVLVAGSQQPDFPGQTDRLLLSVAANQAAIVLQQKRSEEQLRRREQELTDFFENATVGMHWVGPDGIIRRANKAEMNLLGYAPDEYIGRHIAEFHTDQDVIADILRRLGAGETLHDYEARLRCKDGSIKDVLIDSSVLWEDGKFIHTRCFTRDITDRKRAEEALRESEERYRRLVALLPVGVYTCEAGTNLVTFYNEQAATLWGHAPRLGDINERFCGSYKLWLPDGTFLPHDQTPMAVALHEGRAFRNEEVVMERPDGTRITVLVNIDPLRDAEGRLVGAVNVFHDTTALKQAEEALRQSERRFREMIDALPAAVYTTDAEGRVTHFNPACIELSGRRPELGTDQWCVSWKLYHPDGTPMPHDQCPMAVTLKEGRPVRGKEIIAERPDGTRMWCEPHPTPLRDAQGRVIGGINMLVDITERKQMEAALRERETWLAGQSEALEAALNGAPLETSLGILVRTATGLLGPDVRAAFYLANFEGTALHHVVGMPPGYAEAVDGFPIGPESLSCGLAVHTGQPILTSDVMQEPLWVEWRWLAEKFDFRGCWSIPIHTSVRKFTGTLAIYWRQPREATARDLEFVTQVSQAAAIIISRHTEMEVRQRAEEALRRSEAQLQVELCDTQLLQSISAEMIQEEHIEAIYQKIVDAASTIMRSDFASMQMLYPERGSGGELLLLGAKGFPPEAVRFWKWVRTDSNCTCGIALRTGGRVIEPDVANSKIMAGTQDQAALLENGICAAQSTPLFSRSGRLLGMITTHWRDPHQPEERDLRLLDVLARQAADLIERKQAEDARRKQAKRLRLLWEAAAVLLKADNPDTMLRGLLGQIGSHLGVDTYFNFLVDDCGDALRLASYEGIPEETARTITRLEFGQAVCGTVALQRRPIVATFIQQSDDPKVQLVKSFGLRSYACNPLIVGDRLLGTLSFASRVRDEFDSDEVSFIETICHYATMAYERLRLLNELKEADRRKDEFLATLAHELRNPLAPVRNAVNVLNHIGSSVPEARWCRDVIERQVEHLTRLIDDLLDISRITRNKLELRRERIELTEVINSAIESSRPLVEQCSHKLTVTLPPEPIYLNGDLVRLAQTFLNLLNNAAKYTEPGGHISLSAEQENGEVVVRVKDSGIGIPPEKMSRLFEMFYQVDHSLEKSQGGLGIGLSLVRRLVELHGGSVKAHSNGVGKGSEFIVRLPILVEQPENQPSQELDTNGQTKVSRSRRILVVDDNQDSADSISMLLQLEGNEVYTAYDGLEGVEAAERFRPDVVLLDIGMPRLNGEDACRRIRAEEWGKDILLVALTGWGQQEDRQRCVNAGFNHHMTKPVDPDTLMKLLDSQSQAQN